jgi:hypothetical protein
VLNLYFRNSKSSIYCVGSEKFPWRGLTAVNECMNNYCKNAAPYVTVLLWMEENPFLSRLGFPLPQSYLFKILVFLLCCFLPWKQNIPFLSMREKERMLCSGYKYFIINRDSGHRGQMSSRKQMWFVLQSSEEVYIKLSLPACFFAWLLYCRTW